MGSDYNANNINCDSRLTTTKGKALREAIKESRCSFQSTEKPIYWPTDLQKIPDLLDFFI